MKKEIPPPIKYVIISNDGYKMVFGDAKEIIKHLCETDPNLKGMGIRKKPVVFWKIGLEHKNRKQ